MKQAVVVAFFWIFDDQTVWWNLNSLTTGLYRHLQKVGKKYKASRLSITLRTELAKRGHWSAGIEKISWIK